MDELDIYAKIESRLNELQEFRAEGNFGEMAEALGDLIEWFGELDDDGKLTLFIYAIGRIGINEGN